MTVAQTNIISAPEMLPGEMAKTTGGLSEKRVVIFAARHFDLPISEILFPPLPPAPRSILPPFMSWPNLKKPHRLIF